MMEDFLNKPGFEKLSIYSGLREMLLIEIDKIHIDYYYKLDTMSLQFRDLLRINI